MSDVSVFDILDSLCLKPVAGSDLDKMATTWGVVRTAGEADSQLRSRINYMLRHNPGPDSATLQLLLLLEKLGLKAGTAILDAFCPVGHRYRP